MIVPIITSMSEDAMASVPNKMREGAFGLGSTKFEVATKVVPAAASCNCFNCTWYFVLLVKQ